MVTAINIRDINGKRPILMAFAINIGDGTRPYPRSAGADFSSSSWQLACALCGNPTRFFSLSV
jgi:hypothetical protein